MWKIYNKTIDHRDTTVIEGSGAKLWKCPYGEAHLLLFWLRGHWGKNSEGGLDSLYMMGRASSGLLYKNQDSSLLSKWLNSDLLEVVWALCLDLKIWVTDCNIR